MPARMWAGMQLPFSLFHAQMYIQTLIQPEGSLKSLKGWKQSKRSQKKKKKSVALPDESVTLPTKTSTSQQGRTIALLLLSFLSLDRLTSATRVTEEKIKTTENPNHKNMITLIVSALLLPCAGMTVVFLVYLFLLWCISENEPIAQLPEKPVIKKGLSTEELQKLPNTDKLTGTECAVCLDEIEKGQPGRLLPGCNHGFHLHCADTWLSENPICPLCRAILRPDQIPNFTDHDNPPC
ncbi:hypothetical protein NE237_019359 [Protea cynaroides]|uniref:RING-type domain-containing protein n=1 Tax=Protea cynaroides TaxID=273540 RepID=A0A9Q0QPT0_9MAGN|nr:hypothetical protein NE237_019359 [Protea cynaroides]